MRRKPGRYTAVGKRIRALGKQTELAKALGLSQQTISKKLRGEIAITLSDFKRLAKKYRLPMCFFVMGKVACEKTFHGSIIHLVD